MRNLVRVMAVMAVGLGAFAIGETKAAAASPQVNACGCYRDTAGACFCGRKGKCDCPGDCEPKRCEEKRQKELDKEVETETRHARELEKKQQDEEAEKERKAQAPAGDGDPGEAEPESSGAEPADSSSASDSPPRTTKAKRAGAKREARKGGTKGRRASQKTKPAD
jgi:hypothetical protein